jgi:hypothetical protein
MPKFEVGQKHKTRDGRPVRIICTDRRASQGNLLLIGLIDEGPNGETVLSWNLNGKYLVGEANIHKNDLVIAEEYIKKSDVLETFGKYGFSLFSGVRNAVNELPVKLVEE